MRRQSPSISIHALLAESDRGPPVASNGATKFLSTLSLRRATMIHPLLCNAKSNFYPRSPCGERPIVNNIVFMPREFLSTLSLRRATLTGFCRSLEGRNFYPRSPCGERQRNANYSCRSAHPISIHALLAESDLRSTIKTLTPMAFLSTLSLRRATVCSSSQ